MSAPMKTKMQSTLFKLNIWQRLCSYRCYSTLKKNINDILNQSCENGKLPVSTEGWIKSLRKQKKFTFFHLNDGSSSTSLQVVIDSQLCDRLISTGCSVHVEGDLVKSHGQGQAVEVQASSVRVIGQCDNDEYPLKAKSNYTVEYTRQLLHLRPRTEHHSNLLKLRNTASMAVHKYFQDQGYLFIHTPIISSNDCEGAGETFSVETDVSKLPIQEDKPEQTNQDSKSFFGHPAYLTVSGQLHLEAATGAFRKVYNFGPTFRAENSVGRHHLAEFYMIEAELAFTETLEDIMKEMESLVKHTCYTMIDSHESIVDYFWKLSSHSEQKSISTRLIESNFIRMTYSEAIKVLERKNDIFKFKAYWGCDLQKEHEKYLVKHCNNVPVFVTDFPASLKPFYARRNSEENTVAAVDLLVPEVGELFGGSLREERYDIIKSRLDDLQLTESYQWYLDLRRYGSVTHGGFGMGFERLLQCFLGINSIKDTIPFPRWIHHCSL
ncbi:probable asparagine--tRNA ligase, mitochondrial [Ruditapes philippinarum]|uniref:probable asparagine--tRNA ligase, mitochondrial n=1 Tax=Ruditapes philippinarum TaxID=129788 RepID=UPI00295A7ACC|nr:probable asparagine--tRNA ligase, mitochondrial [Ruditapes philippinarum]